MKLLFVCSDDVELEIAEFDEWSVLPLVEELNNEDVQFIQLEVEGDQVFMNKDRIIQITIKKED